MADQTFTGEISEVSSGIDQTWEISEYTRITDVTDIEDNLAGKTLKKSKGV